LRAFSPRDQKAVKAAAETMRDNPKLDEASIITELGVGEALVSCLDEKGTPGIVERALIVPPQAQIGPITEAERTTIIQGSLLAGHYEKSVDRESAYEILKGRAETKQAEASAQQNTQNPASGSGSIGSILGGIFGNGTPNRREGVGEALAKSAARAIGSSVGRQIVRGVLGSLLGGRR